MYFIPFHSDSLLVNERRAVAEALNEVIYSEGDMIVEQGDVGDTFYIIKKGEAVVYKSVPPSAPATEVARLKEGSFFGERALVKNERRAATVTVVSSSMTCLTLDREAFSVLLGPLAEGMHRKIDEDYDGIKHKILGTDSQSKDGGHPHAPSPQHPLHPHPHPLEAKSSDPDHGDGGNNQIECEQEKESKKNKEQIRYEDLSIIGMLGRGSFGSVELVVHALTQKTYALKTVSKNQIVRTGQQEHIISEKKVMMMLDSPFIVKLYETYKSEKYLYFLLEVFLFLFLFFLFFFDWLTMHRRWCSEESCSRCFELGRCSMNRRPGSTRPRSCSPSITCTANG